MSKKFIQVTSKIAVAAHTILMWEIRYEEIALHLGTGVVVVDTKEPTYESLLEYLKSRTGGVKKVVEGETAYLLDIDYEDAK